MLGSLAWMLSNVRAVESSANGEATEPILVTAEVELRELTERTVFRGTIGPSSNMTVEYHGRTEDGSTPLLTGAATRERPVHEGDVLVQISGRPMILIQGDIPSHRTIGFGSVGPDVEQLALALERLGLLNAEAVSSEWDRQISTAVVALYESLGYRPSQAGRTLDDTRTPALSGIQIPFGEMWVSPKVPLRVEFTLVHVGQALGGGGVVVVTDDELVVNASMDTRDARRFLEDRSFVFTLQEGETPTRLVPEAYVIVDLGRDQSNLILIPEIGLEESQRGLNGLIAAERPLLPTESLVVPSSALSVTSSGHARVGRLMEDGSVRAVPVDVGPAAGGYVSISVPDGSVVAGDLVVLGFRG